MTYKYAFVWVFDQNRREYAQPTHKERAAGKVWGPLVWKSHWRPQQVVGETSRSWILQGGEKVPKKNANPRRYAFSELEVDQMAWDHDHRRHIVAAIERGIGGVVTRHALNDIAKIIGYEPKMP